MTHPGRTISILTLTAGCIALAGAAAAQNTGQMPARLKKQIGVLEKAFDETLVDSKNVLVASHEPTRGVYLPEFGVVFTLEAQILTPDRGEWWKSMNWGGKRIKVTDEHGNTIVNLMDDDDDDSDKDSKDTKDTKKHEMTKKELMKDREERYEGAKKELKGVLLDFGSTLSGLREDQSIAVAAFIEDDDMFGESDEQTVILRVKISDLRAHDAGRLSDAQTDSKISIEEY